jgi:hypothetical protein
MQAGFTERQKRRRKNLFHESEGTELPSASTGMHVNLYCFCSLLLFT